MDDLAARQQRENSKGGILVTGAAGFIGSSLLREAADRSVTAVGFDNLSNGKARNIPLSNPRVKFVEGDVRDAEAIRKAVADHRPSAIIHLAALVSVPRSIDDPDLNFSLNLDGTHQVLEAARIGGIKRVVFASSAAVYGNTATLPISEDSPTRPLSPYGAAKLAGENLLCAYANSYGISATALRFFNVFGPRQDPTSPYSGVISIFADRLAAGEPLTVYGDGRQTRDFVSVGDVARCLADAAEIVDPGFRVVNVCTGRATSVCELIDALGEVVGRRPEVRFEPSRGGDIQDSVGSVTALEKLLGWSPSTSVSDGLRQLFREQVFAV